MTADTKIDSPTTAFISTHVIRLLISIFCALGLALTPVTANAAAASPRSMADCAMGKTMPAKPSGSKMDCCVPACQSPASAMLPENRTKSATNLSDRSQPAWTPVKELVGIVSSGLDPPPRA